MTLKDLQLGKGIKEQAMLNIMTILCAKSWPCFSYDMQVTCLNEIASKRMKKRQMRERVRLIQISSSKLWTAIYPLSLQVFTRENNEKKTTTVSITRWMKYYSICCIFHFDIFKIFPSPSIHSFSICPEKVWQTYMKMEFLNDPVTIYTDLYLFPF